MLNLPFRMAAKSNEAAYKKYYGGRYDNISHDTTEEQIKQIYNDCANQYDQVTTNFLVISYELEPWFLPRFPAYVFPHRFFLFFFFFFFSGRVFWPPF